MPGSSMRCSRSATPDATPNCGSRAWARLAKGRFPGVVTIACQPSVRVGSRPARRKELLPAPRRADDGQQVRPSELLPEGLHLELAAEEVLGILLWKAARGPDRVGPSRRRRP